MKTLNTCINKSLSNNIFENGCPSEKDWQKFADNMGVNEIISLIKQLCDEKTQNEIYTKAKETYNF